MADLGNLLDEINNDDESIGNNEDTSYDGDENLDDFDNQRSGSSVPSALTAAVAQRRKLEDERDETTGEDDDREGGRIPDPDYEQLKSLWTNEIASPELMPNDNEIVSIHVDVLEGQEETVDDLFQRSKQQRQSRDGGASGELASLVAQITKMDLDRTRFMLVDLARTRMAKIENHALHNRTMVDRMTEEEVAYLRQYGELLEKHYQRTVLNHMPAEGWKKLDDPEMIDSPDLEQFVFCRALEPIEIDVSGEPNALNDGGEEEDDDDDYGDNLQPHDAGAFLIVMYKKVRELIAEGKVQLLM
eukprot:CAMPEP_0201693866 /NCGR_PEP_ID=MMETSP0578-20130828/6319_1 /ASSEMBLY_ACC=CAM_ASM_000663 /TAXON_ID=267565 /ORGANISM="Skeletonema grethea, Strain CCMP 1804" /LENGTH=301 /DNA_ID=CAMNT_0048179465 /DNA_START=64 /DNA_END=969 /DNA_ORIENTATION=-